MKNNSSHVAVLMGGFGEEKEVSLNSGKACSLALSEAHYKVSEIIVDKNLPLRLKQLNPDICFNALHGRFGEDGTIQGFLNTVRIPYTHSGVSASCIAMNKILAKSLISETTQNDQNPIIFPRNIQNENINHLKSLLPIIIKPICGGSSVGVKIIKNEKDLFALENFLPNKNFLVEPLVGNKELTVTVLRNNPLTVTEIISKKNFFYDYNSKYSKSGSLHVLPAKVSKSIFDQALNWAYRAHTILGCKGISRTDFRYDEKIDKLYMLEINTQPGMTETSLAPEQAKFSNINMPDLVDILVREAEWEK